MNVNGTIENIKRAFWTLTPSQKVVSPSPEDIDARTIPNKTKGTFSEKDTVTIPTKLKPTSMQIRRWYGIKWMKKGEASFRRKDGNTSAISTVAFGINGPTKSTAADSITTYSTLLTNPNSQKEMKIRFDMEIEIRVEKELKDKQRSTGSLWFWSIDNSTLSSGQKGSNTRSIHQSALDNLERINDTGLDHIDKLSLRTVVTKVELVGILVQDFTNNNRSLFTSIVNNSLGWFGNSSLDDLHTKLLVEVGGLDLVQNLRSLQKSGSSTWKNTLLDSSTSCAKSVIVSVLLLTDFNFRRTTDSDDGNTTRELSKSLVQLLLLVVRGGSILNGTLDLVTSLQDVALLTGTVQNDGILFGDSDGTTLTQELRGGILRLDVQFLGENSTTRQNGNVTENVLSIVSKARSLNAGNLNLAPQLVQDTCSQCFTVNILGNNEQWSSQLVGDFQTWKDVLDRRQLLLRKQQEWVFKFNLSALCLGNEVRRDVTSVESHTLGNLKLIFESLTFLDGDNTLLSDFLHGRSQELTNVSITIGGNSGNLSDLRRGSDFLLVLLQELNHGFDGSLGTSSEVHWVTAGSNVLDRLRENCSTQDGSGSGTVTGTLVRLGGNVLQKLGTKVLKLVLKSNTLGDSHTILGDLWSAEWLLNQNITALRTKGDSNGVSEGLHTFQKCSSTFDTKFKLLMSISTSQRSKILLDLRTSKSKHW
ncbi:hypothetical protein OGAPHI_002318 [Ogataea philodendri]|uniref:Uncharacterized protein n=1 Tax=Ogataea philodendri TaxID=1378263 RepID=A0A9P8PC65_9ASCO|nr:uncharacterized protein OGAPHI_002318 [Ogataea philodendri]KAH3668564.1 hypothetical protein OGAPHI_002318 [Ogataea philodendri]